MGDNPSLSGVTGRVKEFVRSERGSSKPESKGTNKGAVSTAAAKGSQSGSSVSSSSTQAKVKQGSSQTTTATAARDTHLPKGMKQEAWIDVRGQRVSPRDIDNIKERIEVKTNGIIKQNDVQFITEQ